MSWTFLTNHAHVLVCIARQPDIRIRDIAELVGITERAAQRIVADLAEEGYVVRKRVGVATSTRSRRMCRCGTSSSATMWWASSSTSYYEVEPSAGLEPATPSLPWRCSTN